MIIPTASKKNISKDRDIERVQNKKRISTTTTFWTIKRTAKPVSIKIKINLKFI